MAQFVGDKSSIALLLEEGSWWRLGRAEKWPPRASPLYGGKVASLIWIRFAAEALRFSVAKSPRLPQEM